MVRMPSHEVRGGRRVDAAVSPESESTAPPLSAVEALAATPFFGDLGTVELAPLVPELEERHVELGGTVYQEGDPADALYLAQLLSLWRSSSEPPILRGGACRSACGSTPSGTRSNGWHSTVMIAIWGGWFGVQSLMTLWWPLNAAYLVAELVLASQPLGTVARMLLR
jgi:hypothetical protein